MTVVIIPPHHTITCNSPSPLHPKPWSGDGVAHVIRHGNQQMVDERRAVRCSLTHATPRTHEHHFTLSYHNHCDQCDVTSSKMRNHDFTITRTTFDRNQICTTTMQRVWLRFSRIPMTQNTTITSSSTHAFSREHRAPTTRQHTRRSDHTTHPNITQRCFALHTPCTP